MLECKFSIGQILAQDWKIIFNRKYITLGKSIGKADN
jgi:hypothetical protein